MSKKRLRIEVGRDRYNEKSGTERKIGRIEKNDEEMINENKE